MQELPQQELIVEMLSTAGQWQRGAGTILLGHASNCGRRMLVERCSQENKQFKEWAKQALSGHKRAAFGTSRPAA